MILLNIAILILIISCLKVSANNFYTSLDTTNSIKGIFILFVFQRHIIPYIYGSGYNFSSFGDTVVLRLDSIMGQSIVALFLFYSGYGIMESIRKKGSEYISAIPRKRFLTVLLNFDVAVLIFIVVALLLGKELSWNQCLFSFTGWKSVGNSNWYIFCILLLYIITWFSFFIKAKSYTANAIICLLLSGGAMIFLSFYKADYWYNTMLCFNAGMFFSLYKSHIERFVIHHYGISIVLLICVMVFLQYVPYSFRGGTYNVFSIAFSLLVVLLTMRIKVNNRTLIWLGKNLFPLYIYQRIPMIVFATVAGGYWVAEYPILYVVVCAVVTVTIAFLYKYWVIKL